MQTAEDSLRTQLASIAEKKAADAFAVQDYAQAAVHYADLMKLVPNHPWAEDYWIKAVGMTKGFSGRLARIQPMVKKRIYVTGCGRSGTWLLSSMLSGLRDARLIESEQHFGYFLKLPDDTLSYIIKRQHDSYLYYEHLPAEFFVINIIRHPFDVLSSTHMGTKNYIPVNRLEGELRSCFSYLLSRKNTITIRYEDLLIETENVQKRIESFLNIRAQTKFRNFYKKAKLPEDIARSMHGIRPLDTKSIGQWRQNSALPNQLLTVLKESTVIQKAVKLFGYDVSL